MNKNIELTLILNVLRDGCLAQEALLDPSINWPLFYKLTCRHRVWHQVNQAVKPHAPVVPIAATLAHRCEKDTPRILITASETTRIARELTQQAIEHCFVKGTLLNVQVYGGLNTRPCKDIDIWVNPTTYTHAVTALESLGYEKQWPKYALTGFKAAWYMRHKHDMAFYHPQHKVQVELHFRLSYPGLPFFPLQDIPLQHITLFNTPVLAPENNVHVLYLMIHGATHGFIRLRWLHDIALFIHTQQCDLNHVYDLAKKIKCEHVVEQVLLLIHAFFNIEQPTMARLIKNPSKRSIRLARMATAFITGDYEMSDGLKNIRLFFKYRVYLATLAVKGQTLRTIWGDLFKIDVLFNALTLPTALSFLYYLIYPVWVMKYLVKKTGIIKSSKAQ